MSWQSHIRVYSGPLESLRINIRSDDRWTAHLGNRLRTVLAGTWGVDKGAIVLHLDDDKPDIPWMVVYSFEPSSTLYGQKLSMHIGKEAIKGFVPSVYGGEVEELVIGGASGVVLDHVQQHLRTVDALRLRQADARRR